MDKAPRIGQHEFNFFSHINLRLDNYYYYYSLYYRVKLGTVHKY